jgi:hypothetical protein
MNMHTTRIILRRLKGVAKLLPSALFAVGSCALLISVISAHAQRPGTHTEMHVDPIADLHGKFTWGTQHPDSTKPCPIDKEIAVYPVVRVVMPGSSIDGILIGATICEAGHWRPLKLEVQ